MVFFRLILSWARHFRQDESPKSIRLAQAALKKLQRLVLIVVAIHVGTIVLFFCAGNAAYVLVCGVIQTTEIAKIDVGNDRFVTVYADNCWEIQTGIYYEATEAGKVVIPKTFTDYYEGTQQFTFRVAYADNQSLVMLYDQVKGYRDLAIIVNFKTHDSWPVDWRPPDKNYDAAKKKVQIFFEQLQRENPNLYRPSRLAP